MSRSRLRPAAEGAAALLAACFVVLAFAAGHLIGGYAGPPRARQPVRAHPDERPPQPRTEQPRLAIVIDDWGYAWEATEAFWRLPAPLTVAVIPFLPLSARQAREAMAAGHEVLVHLPMEPEDPQFSIGPTGITTAMSDEAIMRQVLAAIDAVPGAVGVNNHMGSRATADERVVRAVLTAVHRRGLFFLDSRTTLHTAVPAVTSELGFPYLANNAFIDGEPGDIAYARRRLVGAAELAMQRGAAVAIGHVHPATAQAIAESLPEIERMGVEIVPLSVLFRAAAGAPVFGARPSPAEALQSNSRTPAGPGRGDARADHTTARDGLGLQAGGRPAEGDRSAGRRASARPEAADPAGSDGDR